MPSPKSHKAPTGKGEAGIGERKGIPGHTVSRLIKSGVTVPITIAFIAVSIHSPAPLEAIN